MIYLMRDSSSINGLKSLNHEAEITPLEIPLFYLSRSTFCRSIAAALMVSPASCNTAVNRDVRSERLELPTF